MAQLTFNANDVPPSEAFDLIPAGWQPAEATSSEMKTTKDGEGEYLQIEWTIIDGQYQGRKLWSRLNMKNRNATAVEIAQRDLSAICRSTGIMTLTDSSQLHDRPIMVKVKVRKGTPGYPDDSNEIGGYKPRDGATAAAPAASSGTGAAPWARR